MPIARLVPAIGVVDGVNADFTTPGDFVPGSLVVFLNGEPRVKAEDDGWTETGTNAFRMTTPPVGGPFPDNVQAFARFV